MNEDIPAWGGARQRARSAAIGAARPIARFALRHWIRHDELVRVRQQVRYLAFAQLLQRYGGATGDLTLHELSVFSQNGEDGVIQEILARIGRGSRYFVEIGASGNESNCMFLADALGWSGVFIDAAQEEFGALSRKYRPSDRIEVVRRFVTAEGIDRQLEEVGAPPDLDLLSIDVDGNDYWLWKGVRRFRPRIVIVELNAGLPPGRPVVQPYEPDRPWDGSKHYGASIGALRRLAESKRYRLVHVDTTGTNAFFVDADVADGRGLPEPPDVVDRVPNHFLYGLGYEGEGAGERYLDVDAGP